MSTHSPGDTDAIVWATLDETARRKCCAGARNLANFIRDVAHRYQTQRGDERTNIIDQGERKTYALPREQLATLFQLLEAARCEGSATHFSERQGSVAAPRTGLMLDFDIHTRQRRPAFTDRHYFRIAAALLAVLQRDIDFGAQLPKSPLTGRPPTEFTTPVFFIVKPEATVVAPAGLTAASAPASGPPPDPVYKYGMHLLLPGVRLERAYKRLLLRGFREDPAVQGVLRELEAVGDLAEALDQNSASVPVLFFGSCKRGGTPYVLGAALRAELDVGGGHGGWQAPAVLQRIPPEELAAHNLVAELGLVAEAEYADGRAPLVRKLDFDPRPEVAAQAGDWAARAAGAIDERELAETENSVSTLTLHDPEARHVHALLDLLGPEYTTDRQRWRDVIYAIANTSDKFKPLAVWFSQRCPEKWLDGGAESLDAIWDGARASAAVNPITLRSLTFWARESNPERFQAVMERSYFTQLTEYVYQYGGKLQHYQVAKVLHMMLHTKFVVDIDAGTRGANSYCWFEFVLPGQPMKPGELWKWRKEIEPDDVHIYMSEKLVQVLDQIAEHIEEKRAGAGSEAQAKYYAALGKAFATTRGSLFNDTFKNGVIRQANYLFRRRGFAAALDTQPQFFGCLNGVLRLGPRLSLIASYHEHPVSRSSVVPWKPFNPDDPWTRIVLDGIATIIVEPDARDWILYHAAQGLSCGVKEGLLLMWEGGGQNGKTSFLRWVAKALGPVAEKFNIQLMCCEREDADKPNSAMMRFKHMNWGYAEESNKAQALNIARMKEMVNAGEVTGRDLNSKQESFTMHCNLVAASQYSFLVKSTDHGCWRRLRHYTSKTKFRKDPDPSCPFEKPDDARYNRDYPNDPQFLSSMLSVLGHYYERLENEHRGELKNVRSPTIERETEEFRVSQDALHRWICETIVVSPEHGGEYPLGVLGGYFTDWYMTNIDRQRHVASEIIKDIEATVLAKYLRPAANRTLVLRGCRVLTSEDLSLRPGETLLGEAPMPRFGPVPPPALAVQRERWWEPPAVALAPARARAADEDDYGLAAAPLTAKAAAKASAKAPADDGGATDGIISDSDIDAMLERLPERRRRQAPAPRYTQDDLYGSGGAAPIPPPSGGRPAGQ